MRTLLETAKDMGPVINQQINEEEKNRRLSESVLGTLKQSGFHRLFRPKSLGGLEADPVTVAKLVEDVSRNNTAAGWSMMVANVSTWWCSRLPEKGVEEIYKNGPDTLIAGAFHPPMMATPVNGGYRINGRSPLTSNVHDAHWIFVTALVTEGGQVRVNNGKPEVIGVFMDAKDCQIIDTWYTSGMKATDSNDTAANEVFVPDYRSFKVEPEFQPNSYYSGPLYRFSAMGAGVACLIAPVALAVARNAIQELKLLAGKKAPLGSMVSLKERGVIQRKIGMAEALVQSSCAYLHKTIETCWNKTLSGVKLSPDDKADLLLAASHTNQSCVQAVDMMYSAAGSSAIYTRSKLGRYFTDIQVIRQHGFANESRYETVAQVYFGLQPDLPVLMF
jgi:alkylation response protein AidB-like acyl-CoA dehydrogenase